MPDPKLKAAMEEIKAILREHDIAGIIFLQSPKHAEFLYELGPSWSCIKLENNGVCRIRARRSDFQSREAQEQKVTESVGMINGFHDLTTQATENMRTILELIGSHFDFTHRTFREPEGD